MIDLETRDARNAGAGSASSPGCNHPWDDLCLYQSAPSAEIIDASGICIVLEDIVIEALKNLPDNIAAFARDGYQTKADYETVLISEIDVRSRPVKPTKQANGLSERSNESTFRGRSLRGPTVGNVHSSLPFSGQAPDSLRRVPRFPRWLKPRCSRGAPTGRAN